MTGRLGVGHTSSLRWSDSRYIGRVHILTMPEGRLRDQRCVCCIGIPLWDYDGFAARLLGGSDLDCERGNRFLEAVFSWDVGGIQTQSAGADRRAAKAPKSRSGRAVPRGVPPPLGGTKNAPVCRHRFAIHSPPLSSVMSFSRHLFRAACREPLEAQDSAHECACSTSLIFITVPSGSSGFARMPLTMMPAVFRAIYSTCFRARQPTSTDRRVGCGIGCGIFPDRCLSAAATMTGGRSSRPSWTPTLGAAGCARPHGRVSQSMDPRSNSTAAGLCAALGPVRRP